MDEKPQNVIIADGGKAVSYKPGPGNTVAPGGGGSGGGPGSGDPGSGGSGGGGDSGGGDDDDDDPGDGDDDDPKPDTIAPSIPTGLTGIAVSSSAVSLSWTASTDNVGVAGYCVYRKAMSEDEFTLISKPNGTSYTDNAVNKNITYEYMVSAVDTAKNESENSQAISIWCQAGCKTVWAASCAYPDVSAAVHTAQANDTVMVPAGEAIWTQMLTLNKPVRLIGAGMDRTTIVNGIESTGLDNFLLYLHPDNPQDDPIMEIAGFTINADNNGGCIRIENSSTTHAWKNFRVHHNKIMNNDGSTDAYMAVRVKGLSFGLIDHNIFENNCYDFKVYGRMAYSWNLFPGVDNIGTENYLYIENNISRNESKFTLASGEGARWVYRYNTIEGKLALDAHGDTLNRGVVAHEIYENVATNDFSPVTGGGFSHDYRGGTGIIFNNKAQIGTSGTRGKIQVREEQESCSCPRGCDESPGGDQVNNGYIWNNINTRDNKTIAIWEADAFNHIEEDRDWWDDAEHSPGGESPSNFTYGLHADRPQASVDHDCYWESDTRKLYRSIGDNNWTFVYEPYQYPHPFSVQFPITQQNGDSESPSVPTNLTATVVFSDTIDLSWSASTDDVGVTGYRIYRKTVNEDEYTLIAEPDTTTFSDQNVTGNCIYEYAITAVDAAGNESDKHFSVCIWCRPGAKTIWAASCSHSDIKTAIDTAEQGDTVLVPAGTSVWSDSITITKGIQLLGAGIDKTVIQYDGPSGIGTYAVTVSPDLETAQNDYPVRITGFTFEKLVPVYGTLLLENKHLEHPLTKVMIDHNKFINLVTASRQFSIELRHAMFGVVHNNVLQDGSGAWRFLGGLADGKEVECWAPGSLNAMYFEDNYLYTTADSSSPLAISGGNGNRYVSRYNTFDLSSKGPSAFAQTHDIHGNQPNNSGAGIGFETYGNHRIGTAGRWLDQRAGKVYFFYNRWSKSNGKGSYTVWEEYNDDAFSPHSGEGTAYPRTVAGNLIQHPYGSYYWRNFGGMEGNILSTECNILFDHYNRDYDSNPAVVNDPLILFENQNWWRDNIQPFDGTIDPVGTCGYYKGEPCTKSGIGYGTLEDMNAITPTAEGLGFWVTDQEFDLEKMTGQNPEIPIEGTLYRAVADGLGGFKWEKHYTPLVYPHPLRTLDRIDVP
jgi:hypothetical protein